MRSLSKQVDESCPFEECDPVQFGCKTPIKGQELFSLVDFSMQAIDPVLYEQDSPSQQGSSFDCIESSDDKSPRMQEPLLGDGLCVHITNTDQGFSPIQPSHGQMSMYSESGTQSRDIGSDTQHSGDPEAETVQTIAPIKIKRSQTTARTSPDGEADRKQEELRERNRIAAAKHRVKKRLAIDSLDASLQNASAMNDALRRQTLLLRDQLARWRMLALQHGCGDDVCKCSAIQQYNLQQTHNLVVGAERDVGAAV